MAVRCCANVRGEGRWPRFHQCKHLACVERDGKDYCRVHDPERKKQRDEEAKTRWDLKWAIERRKNACYRALAEIPESQIEQLAKIDRQKIIDLL